MQKSWRQTKMEAKLEDLESKDANHTTCFHEREDINYWYVLGSMAIVAFGIILFVALPNNQVKIHVLVNLCLFAVVQLTGWKTGQFKKERANGFFRSIKAYDIYAHIYGALVIYLFFLTIFYEELTFKVLTFEITEANVYIFTFFIIPVFGMTYELIELVLELVFSYFENKKEIPGTYHQFISEPLPNVFQDVIADAIGGLLGLLYSMIIFNWI